MNEKIDEFDQLFFLKTLATEERLELIQQCKDKLLNDNEDNRYTDKISDIIEVNQSELILLFCELLEDIENTKRDIRVSLLQLILLFIEIEDSIKSVLLQQDILINFLYSDLQMIEEDPELVFYSFFLFSKLLTDDFPDEQKSKLGVNLVDFLLQMYMELDDETNNKQIKSIQDLSLLCFLKINRVFNSSKLSENRALEILFSHEERSFLGQRFINVVNWCDNDEEFNYMCYLIINIFTNKSLADLFFYMNDRDVLVDIIIRELSNLPYGDNDIKRMLYLQIMKQILVNTNFSYNPYKVDQIKNILKILFTNNKDNEIDNDVMELSYDIYHNTCLNELE